MTLRHVFSRIFPALALTAIFHHAPLSGQALEGSRDPIYTRTPKAIHFMLTAKTSDKLYINDSIYFLMDRSPLEQFTDYKKLYDDMVGPYGDVYVLWGASIQPDAADRYRAEWYLNDSLLYLSDVIPNVSFDKIEETFPGNEQYKRMEKLTGVKFDTAYENHTRYMYKEYKDDRSIRNKLFNPLGAMPATWFNGTLVVKRALKYWREENVDDWEKKPCRELIFKDGKLVFDRIKEDVD